MNGNEVATVSGNQCPIGVKYAKAELTNPVRMVTTTLRVKEGALPIVPVKTEAPIPKDKIFPCLKALKNVELQPPIQIGDIIARNICDTGVNIIATRNVGK
jgi:CxxC motif-containing protein